MKNEWDELKKRNQATAPWDQPAIITERMDSSLRSE
jgi:hypothetical protein